MTPKEATEILLDLGWLGIMCRELTDRKLIEAAQEGFSGKEDEKEPSGE